MMSSTLQEHALNDRNHGVFEGHLRQLGRTARSFGEIVTNTERNRADCAVAVREGKTTARDEIAEASGCHGLQQGVFIRVVKIESGPVQRRLVCYFLNGDVFELLVNQ